MKERLKVEKKVNSKAMLLKVSFNAFLFFMAIVFILLAFLIKFFSGRFLFACIVIGAVSYVLIRYFDHNGGLSDMFSGNGMPNTFENDLFNLKNGDTELVKKPTDTSRRRKHLPEQ